MTATHARPQVQASGGRTVRDVLALMLLPVPLVAAALPGAFAGGGTRRWFGGRGESQRADAQAAKDAAAAAFYELDTAQRDLKISIETITAVDNSPRARKAVDDFAALGRRIDEASHTYITAVDEHDLDRDDLDQSVAAAAKTQLTRAKDDLVRVKGDLDRFAQGLGPLLGSAETQLARLAPAVERARQALLGASNALDAVRASGLRADDLAARLEGAMGDTRTSRPPLPDAVARLLIETRVNSLGRPRTMTRCPRPLLRSMVTPGIRCSASARFCSGKLATSVATMESEKPTFLRFRSTACSRLRR